VLFKLGVTSRGVLTCFGPADGGGLSAFSRALDGDLVVQLQALRRLGGGGELQLL